MIAEARAANERWLRDGESPGELSMWLSNVCDALDAVTKAARPLALRPSATSGELHYRRFEDLAALTDALNRYCGDAA